MSWFRAKFPRTGGDTFLADLRTAIRNGFIYTPPYFEALNVAPPLHFQSRHKIKRIVYPEDKLRSILKTKKPELFLHDSTTVLGATQWYKHPVDIFVSRQYEYMQKGVPQEVAFDKVQEQFDEERAEQDIEIELAKQQAEGMSIPDRSRLAFKQYVHSYKQAALRYREESKRIARDKLEFIIQVKRQAKDTSPIDQKDLDDVTLRDVAEYLAIHPGDASFFPNDLVLSSKSIEDDTIDLYDAELDEAEEDYSDATKGIKQEPSERDMHTYQTETYVKRGLAEITAFDQDLDPTLDRDLHNYMKEHEIRLNDAITVGVPHTGPRELAEDPRYIAALSIQTNP